MDSSSRSLLVSDNTFGRLMRQTGLILLLGGISLLGAEVNFHTVSQGPQTLTGTFHFKKDIINWEGSINGNPLQYFCLEISMDGGAR